ncbi:MAG TPA: single-stranded DNA-binding protein [Solirubrobacteraceae bacterium]|jgi:single-strand DNA-binding protein
MSYTDINRVVLVGRLTKDPELRELPSGQSVSNLRIACNSTRRDAAGEYHQRPHYFDVAVFAGQAETVCRYLTKGRRIAIDGRLEWREWETAEQQRRQAVSVVAESVEFLDGGAGEHDDAALGGDGDDGTEADGLAGIAATEREAELVF